MPELGQEFNVIEELDWKPKLANWWNCPIFVEDDHSIRAGWRIDGWSVQRSSLPVSSDRMQSGVRQLDSKLKSFLPKRVLK